MTLTGAKMPNSRSQTPKQSELGLRSATWPRPSPKFRNESDSTSRAANKDFLRRMQKVRAALDPPGVSSKTARLFRTLTDGLTQRQTRAILKMFCYPILIDARIQKPKKRDEAVAKAQKKRFDSLLKDRLPNLQEDVLWMMGKDDSMGPLLFLQKASDLMRFKGTLKSEADLRKERNKELSDALSETLFLLVTFTRAKLRNNRVPFEILADMLTLTSGALDIPKEYTGSFIKSRVRRFQKPIQPRY
jgi:hypothetical protein